ncbi:Arrestin domain-containing protein 2 [Operophtera brumata]|uniref:Arrestin domain-containing protein 2 n=75 Tax=Obtectomera TaxID=104431 RepID=A0A0L7LTI0_OPEBR|nr:Arrestin domain-containing protein 2 [Operophtera brumata]
MPRKLLKFLIVFDNTSLLYFPGQFLSGKVLMELQDDTPVLGLHFHVVGEGVVRVGSGRHERLFDKENYIDFRMRLLGEPGHGASILSPGIHSFPFKLGLPMGLPSTFLGTHGWVQYYCKAALREPNGLTHKNQQVFIVMNPIDLNLEPPVLAQQLECSIEHRLGVGCVGGGGVSCRVALDRGAYVPGESILLTARLHNHSRTTIKSTRVALTEVYTGSAWGGVSCRVALDRGAYVPSESILLMARLHNHSRTTIKSTRVALTEVYTGSAWGPPSRAPGSRSQRYTPARRGVRGWRRRELPRGAGQGRLRARREHPADGATPQPFQDHHQEHQGRAHRGIHRLGVGCVGGGGVSCRVALDRGEYVPGESILLTARLHNHSRTTIKSTRVALTEVYIGSAWGVWVEATGAYVPGESILLTARLHNHSRTTIKSTRVALTETIQYSAHGKGTAKEVRELASLAHGKTRAGDTDEWSRELLYVPPLPPTNLRGCHLIAVQYDVFSLDKEVKLQLPILLGTYPFRDEDGAAPAPATHYPSTLPIFRPWLHEKPNH